MSGSATRIRGAARRQQATPLPPIACVVPGRVSRRLLASCTQSFARHLARSLARLCSLPACRLACPAQRLRLLAPGRAHAPPLGALPAPPPAPLLAPAPTRASCPRAASSRCQIPRVSGRERVLVVEPRRRRCRRRRRRRRPAAAHNSPSACVPPPCSHGVSCEERGGRWRCDQAGRPLGVGLYLEQGVRLRDMRCRWRLQHGMAAGPSLARTPPGACMQSGLPLHAPAVLTQGWGKRQHSQGGSTVTASSWLTPFATCRC